MAFPRFFHGFSMVFHPFFHGFSIVVSPRVGGAARQFGAAQRAGGCGDGGAACAAPEGSRGIRADGWRCPGVVDE